MDTQQAELATEPTQLAVELVPESKIQQISKFSIDVATVDNLLKNLRRKLEWLATQPHDAEWAKTSLKTFDEHENELFFMIESSRSDMSSATYRSLRFRSFDDSCGFLFSKPYLKTTDLILNIETRQSRIRLIAQKIKSHLSSLARTIEYSRRISTFDTDSLERIEEMSNFMERLEQHPILSNESDFRTNFDRVKIQKNYNQKNYDRPKRQCSDSQPRTQNSNSKPRTQGQNSKPRTQSSQPRTQSSQPRTQGSQSTEQNFQQKQQYSNIATSNQQPTMLNVENFPQIKTSTSAPKLVKPIMVDVEIAVKEDGIMKLKTISITKTEYESMKSN